MTDADAASDSASAPTDRRTYLRDTLQLLWPEPCQVTIGAAAKDSSASGVVSADLVVIPNLRRPTLVLPRRPRRVTAAGIRRYKTSAGFSTRAKLGVLALAARTGATDLLAPRIMVTQPDGEAATIVGHLSTALGQPVHIALYIGVSRAVEKPVLQLLGDTGEAIGFAKVGVNDLTRALVRGEAETLRRLGSARTTTVVTPRLLHAELWNGLEVMVQEALSGDSKGFPNPAVLAAATNEVADVAGRTRRPLADSSYLVGLRGRIDDLPSTPWRELVSGTLHHCVEQAAMADVSFGSWHGDWAPWNMASAGRRLVTWDWEHFGDDVPVGFDAVHFNVQDRLVTAGDSAAHAVADTSARARAILTPMGVSGDQADLVLTLYLIEIVTRYLHDREDEAGTRMGQLHTWLADALARQHSLVSAPP